MTKDQADQRPRKYVETGERLKKARIAAGFEKQTELAKAAGLVPLTINRVEKGRGPLSKEVAEALAPHLNCTAAYLMYGSESEPSNDRLRRFAAVVEQYLTDDPYGKEASPRARKLLERLDFAQVGFPNPTVRDVHRAHEWIEINLAIERQRHT